MELMVNGLRMEVRADPTARLVDVLRGELDLNGVKEGCGIGICGTCTVLLEGRPVSSCLLMVAQAERREVTTIEGLAEADRLHPIQQAFVDHSAFQCAFCTPGFALTAAALLADNPNPSEEEIQEYLAGNLCRCGSYGNILTALRRLAASRD